MSKFEVHHICRTGRPAAPATMRFSKSQGFTLLEVLVALTVLAIGAALTLSLISGSLGNIRKVQLRTRTIEHAESVMELALLDESIQQPTAFTGDFEDGTRWSVRVEEYDAARPSAAAAPRAPRRICRSSCSRYTVEMFSPDSRAPDYRLQTLKLVRDGRGGSAREVAAMIFDGKKRSVLPEAGFTLLEMIVAVTLVAMMAVGLWAVLRISIRSWSRGTEFIDANQRQRSIMDMVRKQLASAYPLFTPIDG